MTIEKILVPTDFSECAAKSVDIAIPMAKHLDAELLFLHLYPDPVGSLHIPVIDGNLKLSHTEVGKIKGALDTLVRQAEADGVNARAILVYDHGNESIEEYADSYGVDLVIMGTHGLSGIAEWFTGSNAQRVVKRSDVPVLVVKQEVMAGPIRNILFASSFEENVTAPMLFITGLAKVFDATIHLLFVNLAIHSIEHKAMKRKMDEVIERFPENRFTINFAETNNEEHAIERAAEKVRADLVTLTPHDRDGVLQWFSHSVAENLVNHHRLPVLVLPEAD